MAKRSWAAALAAVLWMPAALIGQAGAGGPGRQSVWLEEEVGYIISPRERDVFLRLQTDREREIFVEAFWRHRDPTPGTPRNEYRDEHYRRLAFANERYGRGSPLPGWKTDRGRIHIILGPPRNIETFDSVMNVNPTEIWFYLGDPQQDLPTAFNVIFFKRNGIGDYILFSPGDDGPQSLISDSLGDYRDEQAAYKELQRRAPTLAHQVLSLIPNERAYPGAGSLASTKLLASILDAPKKRIDADYADALLRFKDFVEVEYTANYIASAAEVQVIRGDGDVPRVHFTIEPARITAEEIEGRYEIRFQLTGRVSDEAGRTVYQYDKDITFSLTPAELDDIRAKSLSIQDMFPLVPGSFSFDVLLKNVLSKEFTGASRTVTVPGPGGAVRMSPLLLAYGVENRSGTPGERLPFRTGHDQLLCQARKTFGTGEQVVLFGQVYGLTEALTASATLRYDFLKEGQPFLTKRASVAPSSDVATLLDVQPLRDFPPGYYQARATFLDGSGKELASAKADFEVSAAAAVPRPMVISKVAKVPGPEDDLYIPGLQSLNLGDLDAARARLGEAYGQAPQRMDVAVAYAQTLFRLKDYRTVKDVLGPLAGAESPAPEVPALLGQACHALGEYAGAAGHYISYLTRFGANVDILNWLGTCQYQLGDTAEALKAWTRSLELNPNQEKLRALVESVKKK